MRRGQVPLKAFFAALAGGTLGGTFALRHRNSKQEELLSKPDASTLAENSEDKKDSKSQMCELVCSSDPAEEKNLTEPEPKKPSGNWLGNFFSREEEAKPKPSSTIRTKPEGSLKTPKDWHIHTFDAPYLQQESETSPTSKSEIQLTDKPGTEAQFKTPNWIDLISPHEDKPKAFSAKPPVTDLPNFEKYKSGNPWIPAEDKDKPDLEEKPKTTNWLGGPQDEKPRKENVKQTEEEPDSFDYKPDAKSIFSKKPGGLYNLEEESNHRQREDHKNNDLESEVSAIPKTGSKTENDCQKKWFSCLSQDGNTSRQAKCDSDSSISRHPIKEKGLTPNDSKEPTMWKCETSDKSASESQYITMSVPIGLLSQDNKTRKKDFEMTDEETVLPDSNAEEQAGAIEDHSDKNNWMGGLFPEIGKHRKEDSEKIEDETDSDASKSAELPEISSNSTNWMGELLSRDSKAGEETLEQAEEEPVSQDLKADAKSITSGWLDGLLPADDKPRKEDSEITEDGTEGGTLSSDSNTAESDGSDSTGWLGWLFPHDDKSGKENAELPGDKTDIDPEELVSEESATTDGGSEPETCICIKTEEMKKALRILTVDKVC